MEEYGDVFPRYKGYRYFVWGSGDNYVILPFYPFPEDYTNKIYSSVKEVERSITIELRKMKLERLRGI